LTNNDGIDDGYKAHYNIRLWHPGSAGAYQHVTWDGVESTPDYYTAWVNGAGTVWTTGAITDIRFLTYTGGNIACRYTVIGRRMSGDVP
jgi:hypothetical protein